MSHPSHPPPQEGACLTQPHEVLVLCLGMVLRGVCVYVLSGKVWGTKGLWGAELCPGM